MCINCNNNKKSSMILVFLIFTFVTNSAVIKEDPSMSINSTNFQHSKENINSNNFLRKHTTDITALSDTIQYLKKNYSIHLNNNDTVHHHHFYHHHSHHHLAKVGMKTTDEKTPLFPTDLFTTEERRHGFIILHVLGVAYMFVALAIVCDEFFVPSLDVIIEKLDIADDVAGATFMAAGGSAPELFTSIIGVFVSFDDVGIGTIVGSAVFNILFVIGMCAIFSRTVLSLTWWPLFRDCTFYSISLLTLIYFFRDNYIYWYEALILFGFYISYVCFMKWNGTMEKLVKRIFYHNRITRVRSTDQLMPSQDSSAILNPKPVKSMEQEGCQTGDISSAEELDCINSYKEAGCSSIISKKGLQDTEVVNKRERHVKCRHGLLQLMVHTIDPLHDGEIDDKASQLHAITSLKVLLNATKTHNGTSICSSTTYTRNHSEELKVELPETVQTTTSNLDISREGQSVYNGKIFATPEVFESMNEETTTNPLDMAWPSTSKKRITYILVAPILFPLWLTLPDTRTAKGKKFFVLTFIGSIFWIAAYSYLMVWWANVVGDTVRIPAEVMGLTFLAAGTSIPDLITSVIVARKGFGDMAVSSSVGSNIFDVTVGLPVPWLLYGWIYGSPVEVNSVGMVCSIAILFCMLLFVILSIAFFKWRMHKSLGFTMFLLYFVFVSVSLMFEYEILVCPA